MKTGEHPTEIPDQIFYEDEDGSCRLSRTGPTWSGSYGHPPQVASGPGPIFIEQ